MQPLLDRALAALRGVREVTRRHPTVTLVVAVAAFGVTSWLAFRSLPEGTELAAWPLVWLAVLAPLTTAGNAAEYVAIGRALGQRVGAADAVRTAVLSSAANLLPIPGAVAVRAHRLRAAGYRRSIGATTAAGICWLGTALAVAAVAHLATEREARTLVVLAAGLLTLAASWWLHARSATVPDPGVAWLLVLACELGQVAVAAVRYAFAVAALDLSASATQSLGLAVAPVAASAVGLLPGGLGLREAIAASLAALVDLPASVGAAATAVDRVVGLAVLAVLAAVALHQTRDAPLPAPVTDRGSGPRSPSTPPSPARSAAPAPAGPDRRGHGPGARPGSRR